MAKKASTRKTSAKTTSKKRAPSQQGSPADSEELDETATDDTETEDSSGDQSADDPSLTDAESVEVDPDDADDDDDSEAEGSDDAEAEPAAAVEAAEDDDGPRQPPPEGVGLVLIVGPLRAGTTVIMDWVRMHPYARIERSSGLFSKLVRGSHNRYPRDLTVQSGGIRIEQRPGKVVRVPGFDRKEDENKGGWMVEKIHPHFFMFESAWLTTRLEGLERKGVPIRVVYRGRSPKAVARSQWLYKRRVPSWQEWLDEEEVAAMAVRSFEAMAELIEQRPGAIMSRYEDDGDNPADTIEQLYAEIWPDQPKKERADRAAEVAAVTSIPRRGRHAERRFTANDEIDTETTEAVEQLLKAHRNELNKAERLYKAAFGS